jgi:succinoglycan biosynthesis transport protein ExoP
MSDTIPQLPQSNLPVPQAAYTISAPGSWYGPELEPEEPAVPLSHYLWILRRHAWKIFSFVLTCVIATFIVSSRLTPVYESTATIDIDLRTPTSVVGNDPAQGPLAQADQFLATQIKLIQSDSVLRPVVRKFHLDQDAKTQKPALSSPAAQDAPVSLPNLKVTRPPNTFLLLVSYRSTDARLAADVANAVADSYREHTYNIRFTSSANLSRFMEKQLEDLRAKMERSSAALAQFEREMNVINPEQKTDILSSRLLQLNTEFTNAQADRLGKEAAFNSVASGSLEAAAVSSQGAALSPLLTKLDDAQEKFAEAKLHFGANHPEYRKAAAQVAAVQQQLEATRASIARRVETEYRDAVKRQSMLEKAVAATKAEYDALNARRFEYQNLKQEADADKKLYDELTTRIKEAGINAGFENNAVRLADPARPALEPVFPNLKLNLVLAFLLSSLLAVGAAVLSDALDTTVRDAVQVRRLFNTEVIGALPLVREWRRKKLLKPSAAKSGLHTNPASDARLLGLSEAGSRPAAASEAAQAAGVDGAVVPASDPRPSVSVCGPILPLPADPPAHFREAIRTLRNSILLGSFDRPLRSLLVTSAVPRDGKSTTALHLAIAHAEQRRRTLLIDADLRRPSIHQAFNLPAETSGGLTAALSNGMDWRSKLASVQDLPDLSVLTAGLVNRRSPDLLGPSIGRLLDEAAADYDLVILDAPPLLGFPEPLQLAAAVDGVLVVGKSGSTDRKAMGAVFASLQRVRANVIGLVLNEVGKQSPDGYSDYSYYTNGKYYKHYNRA